MAAGIVEWSKPQFVNQNQLVAQQTADDLADGVVGQAAVQRLDQIAGDDVADLQPRSTARTPQPTRAWLLPVPLEALVYGLAKRDPR